MAHTCTALDAYKKIKKNAHKCVSNCASKHIHYIYAASHKLIVCLSLGEKK